MADFKHWMDEAGYALEDPNARAEAVSAFAVLAQAEALGRIAAALERLVQLAEEGEAEEAGDGNNY